MAATGSRSSTMSVPAASSRQASIQLPSQLPAPALSDDHSCVVIDQPLCWRAQIRSHAQKFFLKLEKEGQQEDIPPPRPKKRPARPYPHKQQASSGAKSKRMRSAVAEDASELKRTSSGGSSDAGARRASVARSRHLLCGVPRPTTA